MPLVALDEKIRKYVCGHVYKFVETTALWWKILSSGDGRVGRVIYGFWGVFKNHTQGIRVVGIICKVSK